MTLERETKEIDNAFVNLMRSRLEWCVETERYEMAARLRDLIEYETTEDAVIKNQYYMKLLKKYEPDFYESVKHKYE